MNNDKMKRVVFGNNIGYNIINDETRNKLRKMIEEKMGSDFNEKKNILINKRNIKSIHENEYKITMNTYGKKYLLFLTNYKNKNISIFINKKSDQMIISQFSFKKDLYNGTLFEGDFIKNDENKWVYLIQDLIMYKGKNILERNLNERIEALNYLKENEYKEDLEQQTCYMEIKKYYTLNYIRELIKEYTKYINYKCNGIFFKSILNEKDDLLFILPECRIEKNEVSVSHFSEDQEQINNTNNHIENENSKVNNTNISITNETNVINNMKTNLNKKVEEDIFGDMEEIETIKEENVEMTNEEVVFVIRKNPNKPVFDLYVKNGRELEKHSYAHVQSMKLNQWLNKLLKDDKTDINEEEMKRVKCKWNNKFKKWEPLEETNLQISSIQKINSLEEKYENSNDLDNE